MNLLKKIKGRWIDKGQGHFNLIVNGKSIFLDFDIVAHLSHYFSVQLVNSIMSVLSLHKIATIPSDGLLFAVGFDTNMLIWFSYRVRS